LKVHLYIHPESGCAFLARSDSVSGDGCLEYVCVVEESYAPRNQAMFEAVARAAGVHAPEHYEFSPNIHPH
jgi:hypothetical protein